MIVKAEPFASLRFFASFALKTSPQNPNTDFNAKLPKTAKTPRSPSPLKSGSNTEEQNDDSRYHRGCHQRHRVLMEIVELDSERIADWNIINVAAHRGAKGPHPSRDPKSRQRRGRDHYQDENDPEV